MTPYGEKTERFVEDMEIISVRNKDNGRELNLKRLQAAFPQYKLIGISAKYGNNIEKFYEMLIDMAA